MTMHNGVQLSDVEYEELLTLAEAADNGEDVMLTAFMRLCPTGQEGAFDESVVAAYAALADLGFIEGVQEGCEFFLKTSRRPAVRSPIPASLEIEATNPLCSAKPPLSMNLRHSTNQSTLRRKMRKAITSATFSRNTTNMPSRSRISKPKRPKRMTKAKETTKRSKKLAIQPKLRPMKHLATRLRRFSKAPQPNKPLLRVPWRALSQAPSPQPSCASCCKRAL